jgi:hypothetical protein
MHLNPEHVIINLSSDWKNGSEAFVYMKNKIYFRISSITAENRTTLWEQKTI